MGSSPGGYVLGGDGVMGPEDEGGDGVEELEKEGDDKLSSSLDGSMTDGLLVSSVVALVRWRVWSRFRQ